MYIYHIYIYIYFHIYPGAHFLRGSQEVLCIDSSEAALELLRRSAAMNSVQDRVRRPDTLLGVSSVGLSRLYPHL